MFLGSTMKAILAKTEEVAEKLNILPEHRDPIIRETTKLNTYTPRFRVSVGEIHCGTGYILTFKRAELISIERQWWAIDTSWTSYIASEQVEIPV